MPNNSNLILCPRCGDVNAPTALVCGICGTRLPQQSNNEPLQEVLAAPDKPNSAPQNAPTTSETVEKTKGEVAQEQAAHEDVAGEIDARRAHHLLERAFILAGRYEFEAAVLACRQSLLLLPNVALASALLGLLLKRQNDAEGAARAYAKAAELSPARAWKLSSLETLHKFFKEDETALLAAQNAASPAIRAESATTSAATTSETLDKSAPVAATPVAATPVAATPVAGETHFVSGATDDLLQSSAVREPLPARPLKWLPLAAAGAVIFFGLWWAVRNSATPTPVTENTAALPITPQEENTVSATIPTAEGSENQLATSANGDIQATAPTASAGTSAAPPVPASRQTVPVPSSVAAPAESLAQSDKNNSRSLPAATPIISRAPETVRDSGPALPSPVRGTSAPDNGTPNSATPDNATSTGGSVAPSPPAGAPPSSQGNKRPGAPRSSFPGAFQPGRP